MSNWRRSGSQAAAAAASEATPDQETLRGCVPHRDVTGPGRRQRTDGLDPSPGVRAWAIAPHVVEIAAREPAAIAGEHEHLFARRVPHRCMTKAGSRPGGRRVELDPGVAYRSIRPEVVDRTPLAVSTVHQQLCIRRVPYGNGLLSRRRALAIPPNLSPRIRVRAVAPQIRPVPIDS